MLNRRDGTRDGRHVDDFLGRTMAVGRATAGVAVSALRRRAASKVTLVPSLSRSAAKAAPDYGVVQLLSTRGPRRCRIISYRFLHTYDLLLFCLFFFGCLSNAGIRLPLIS